MNALDLTASINDAKQLINEEYQNGEITESERDYKLEHILGY